MEGIVPVVLPWLKNQLGSNSASLHCKSQCVSRAGGTSGHKTTTSQTERCTVPAASVALSLHGLLWLPRGSPVLLLEPCAAQTSTTTDHTRMGTFLQPAMVLILQAATCQQVSRHLAAKIDNGGHKATGIDKEVQDSKSKSTVPLPGRSRFAEPVFSVIPAIGLQ